LNRAFTFFFKKKNTLSFGRKTLGKSQNALAQDILKTKNDPCDGRKTMFFLTPTCLVKKNKIQNAPAQLNYNKSSQVSTKEKKKFSPGIEDPRASPGESS
jgi:hypothetical protein